MTRKVARTDCSYVIYEAVSSSGQNYIGVTRKAGKTPKRAIEIRWIKHLSRARCEMREWKLYVYLREQGLDKEWTHNILEVVRGRGDAYARERIIVKERRPTLNDQYSEEWKHLELFRKAAA